MTELAIDDFTIAQLRAMAPVIPGVGSFFDRLLASSYKDFVDVLYRDIDAVIEGFQENPELLKEDGEDRFMAMEAEYDVRTCNDMSKFNWDVDYSYYVNEANKLLIPFQTELFTELHK